MAVEVIIKDPQAKSELNLAHFKENCRRYHDVVCDYESERPEIVALCGSSRFSSSFMEVNYALTLTGYIVLMFGCDIRTKRGRELGLEARESLNDLHKRRIDLADRIMVVTDKTKYVGDTTKSEIAYAKARNKPVHYSVD